MRGPLVACALAGCYTASPEPASLGNSAITRSEVLVITRSRFGPVAADTPALLMPLRRALVGFEVRPVYDGGLQYDIYRNGERLAYVVPDAETAAIFNIHAVSPQVSVKGRDWRVGVPVRGAKRLTRCECWGEQPTCFRDGEHVAVSFSRECADLEGPPRPEGFPALEGVPVDRVIWSPHGFGVTATGEVDDIHVHPP